MADKQADRRHSLSLEQWSSSFLYAIPVTDTHKYVACEGSVNMCEALIIRHMQVKEEAGVYSTTTQFRMICKSNKKETAQHFVILN